MKTAKTDRKVITRSPRRKVGYINCKWFQNERIEHESQLEKRFVQCALLCPRLLSIKSQPFKIQISKKSTYTPDFLLTFDDGSIIVVEVKIQAKVARNVEKFNIAHSMLKAKDFEFFVLTELEIDRYRQSLIAAEILRYAKSEFALPVMQSVMNKMANNVEKYISIKDLAQLSDCSNEVIYHLIANRQLTLHPSDYLSAEARVYTARNLDGTGKQVFANHFNVTAWVEQKSDISNPPETAKGLRKRVKRTKVPYVRARTIKANQPIPHPLNSLAGGLPQTIKFRRPGNAE